MIFGSPAIRPTDLAEIVATKVRPMTNKLLRKSHKSLKADIKTPGRRAIRTKAVKYVLRREAKKHGFRVFPDNDKRFTKPKSQWLFDLIWWNDGSRGKGVELAVESEWNADEGAVVHDFEKLLAVKSPLKLMIYRARPKTTVQVRESIKTYLKNYGQHVVGENYVMCE